MSRQAPRCRPFPYCPFAQRLLWRRLAVGSGQSIYPAPTTSPIRCHERDWKTPLSPIRLRRGCGLRCRPRRTPAPSRGSNTARFGIAFAVPRNGARACGACQPPADSTPSQFQHTPFVFFQALCDIFGDLKLVFVVFIFGHGLVFRLTSNREPQPGFVFMHLTTFMSYSSLRAHLIIAC